MVRKGENWNLGEPEVNDQGLPVIHNIVEKLGCIRPSPDLLCIFPEDPGEFAKLQSQLFAARTDGGDEEGRKISGDLVFSHQGGRDRASSSESDHSDLSKDCSQMLHQRQPENLPQMQYQQSPLESPDSQLGDKPLYQIELKQEASSIQPRMP